MRGDRLLEQTVREQERLEKTVKLALPMVKEDAKPEEISEEFIAHFVDGNRLVADEDMRTLWAKLWQGKRTNPAVIPLTLRFLSTLGKLEGQSFTNFCRFVIDFCGVGFNKPPPTVRRVPLVLDFADPIYVREPGVTYADPDGPRCNRVDCLQSCDGNQRNAFNAYDRDSVFR